MLAIVLAATLTQATDRNVRFGVGLSGGAVPSYYGVAWGVGGEAGVAFEPNTRWSIRGLANFTHTENGPYSTNVGLLIVMPTFWFGIYGLGAAAMVGAGDISKRGAGPALGVLASPVRLRFGSTLRHEVSLELGALLITTDVGVAPFGRFSYTLFY